MNGTSALQNGSILESIEYQGINAGQTISDSSVQVNKDENIRVAISMNPVFIMHYKHTHKGL